jgi:RNase P subunit RPR2
MDSDELDGDLNLSDCEDRRSSFRAKNKDKKRKRPARRIVQEIDTNVYKIAFNTLKDNAELATGDPVFCEECKAVFNQYSKVEERKGEDGEQMIWKCEFCNKENEVDIEDEEKP